RRLRRRGGRALRALRRRRLGDARLPDPARGRNPRHAGTRGHRPGRQDRDHAGRLGQEHLHLGLRLPVLPGPSGAVAAVQPRRAADELRELAAVRRRGDGPSGPGGPVTTLEFAPPSPNPARPGRTGARMWFGVPADLAGQTYELAIYDLS